MTSRPFAVFDIDGTLIRWQLYHAVADQLAKQGLIDSKTYSAIRSARMDWKRRTHDESFKDYEHRLVAVYKSVLHSLTTQQFEQAAQQVFNEYKDQAYTYTRDLILSLKQKGYLLFAISGSQTEVVAKVAQHYGFDDWVGANYERKGRQFTGKVHVHLNDKDKVLRELVAKHKANWQNSIAVGDSISDIPMLAIVERPIAFNPEKKLYNEAVKNGWEIVVERKNMVYQLTPKGSTYRLK